MDARASTPFVRVEVHITEMWYELYGVGIAEFTGMSRLGPASLIAFRCSLCFFIFGCAKEEFPVSSVFTADAHQGCIGDIWSLGDHHFEVEEGGTKLKVFLDVGVDEAKARALLTSVGDANELLPQDIEAPEEVSVLLCGEGTTSYAVTLADSPLLVAPIVYRHGPDEPTSLDKNKAVFLHEYGHIVFGSYLTAHSSGFRAYVRHAQRYKTALEAFSGVPKYDPDYLSLRQRVWELDIAKDRYHSRVGFFEELVADTLVVAVMDDGKAMANVFSSSKENAHLASQERFRDFTLDHKAGDTPFKLHLVFAPVRSAIWSRYGSKEAGWSDGFVTLFASSLDEIETWVSAKEDYKTSVALNRGLLQRLQIAN